VVEGGGPGAGAGAGGFCATVTGTRIASAIASRTKIRMRWLISMPRRGSSRKGPEGMPQAETVLAGLVRFASKANLCS
jgi:hypothetical protein